MPQAVLDGMQSLRDPRFRDGLLPLWSITVYRRIHEAVSARKEAERALEWLSVVRRRSSDDTRSQIDALAVESRLLALPWGKQLRSEGTGYPMTLVHLIQRLCNHDMLNVDIVDMMLSWIRRQAERRGVRSRYSIYLVSDIWYFISEARNATYFKAAARSSWMQRLRSRMHTEPGTVLLVPIIYRWHFVLAEIDMKAKVLTVHILFFVTELMRRTVNSYPPGTTVHRDVQNKVLWWLRACFDNDFCIQTTTALPHANQPETDSISCGLCG